MCGFFLTWQQQQITTNPSLISQQDNTGQVPEPLFTAWRDILQWIWLGNCAASSWIITLTGMQVYTKLPNPLDNTASPQMLVTLRLLLLLFCFVLFSSISSNNRKRWKEVNNHKLQLDFFCDWEDLKCVSHRWLLEMHMRQELAVKQHSQDLSSLPSWDAGIPSYDLMYYSTTPVLRCMDIEAMETFHV